MSDKKTAINKAYKLLSDVLMTGFGIDTYYITPADYQSVDVDYGLRKMMWEDFDTSEVEEQLQNGFEPFSSMIVRSNLGFYNYMIIINDAPQSDIVAVGPFRTENISRQYVEQILREARLSTDKIEKIESLYRHMPQADLTTIVRICIRIMSEAVPEISKIQPHYIEYTDKLRPVAPDAQLLDAQAAGMAADLKKHMEEYELALHSADMERARRAMMELIRASNFDRAKSVSGKKEILLYLNAISMLILFKTTVNPGYVAHLVNKISSNINECTSQAELSYMPYDICHKYGLLVRNYANSSYSKVVRDAIDYISFHLDEELSLEGLAKQLGRNKSSFSALFKKEMGCTLTEYVQQTRVQQAIRLMNTTELSISEIAVLVGYGDFAYFSRVFKNIVGMSPREYRNHSR